MKDIVKKDILNLLKSKLFYLSLLMFIMAGYITFMRNRNIYALSDYENIGVLNTFIYSNIRGNAITSIFAPIMITLPVLAIISTRHIKIKKIKKLFKEIFFLSVLATIVVLFAYCLLFVISIFVDPYPSNILPVINQGLFAEMYNKSIVLYIIIYLLHAIVCGIVFSLFSYSLYCLTNNYFFALTIPNAYYYLSLSFKGIFSGKLLKLSNFILPTLFYDFENTSDTLINFSQITFMFLLSLVLLSITFLKKIITTEKL